MIAGCAVFGLRALLVIAVTTAACIFFEWGFEKLCHQKSTICDLSAAVTGVLLALNLPVSIPLWQAVFGALVAIVAVKGLFGGIGKNFANPAITARIVMFLAFSKTVYDKTDSAYTIARLAANDAARCRVERDAACYDGKWREHGLSQALPWKLRRLHR